MEGGPAAPAGWLEGQGPAKRPRPVWLTLEEELVRAEAGGAGPGDVQREDAEVEEDWEDLLLWCASHGCDVGADSDAGARLGRGLDIFRLEQFSPVLLPPGGEGGGLREGDAYLFLNRL